MKNGMSMIVMIGVMGMLVTMLMYFYTLSEYTDAGKLAGISDKVKEKYGLESVGVHLSDDNGRTMSIHYVTLQDSGMETEKQNEEMRGVATLALSNLQPVDRKKIETVNVHRSEIHGSGCFRSEYKADLVVENPFRSKEQPQRFPK